MPDAHDIYVFPGRSSDDITWYCRSNLVSVRGVMYCVYYRAENLLESYAWLACRHRPVLPRNHCLVVHNTDLRWGVIRGVMTIYGTAIDRYTGKWVNDKMARAKCVRMRLSVPWHTPGFWDGMRAVYCKRDRLNCCIRRLQRWARATGMRSRQRAMDLLDGLRDVGRFRLLGDDVFSLVLHFVFRPQIRIRQAECEFEHPRGANLS